MRLILEPRDLSAKFKGCRDFNWPTRGRKIRGLFASPTFMCILQENIVYGCQRIVVWYTTKTIFYQATGNGKIFMQFLNCLAKAPILISLEFFYEF